MERMSLHDLEVLRELLGDLSFETDTDEETEAVGVLFTLIDDKIERYNESEDDEW